MRGVRPRLLAAVLVVAALLLAAGFAGHAHARHADTGTCAVCVATQHRTAVCPSVAPAPQPELSSIRLPVATPAAPARISRPAPVGRAPPALPGSPA